MNKLELQKKLGKKIRALRINKNLTQLDLAILVNKDRQSIQRLESGKVNPTLFYVCEICKGLNISLKDLLVEIELTNKENQ
jgi:transcriptional regulator with XRE-family HTH domain